MERKDSKTLNEELEQVKTIEYIEQRIAIMESQKYQTKEKGHTNTLSAKQINIR